MARVPDSGKEDEEEGRTNEKSTRSVALITVAAMMNSLALQAVLLFISIRLPKPSLHQVYLLDCHVLCMTIMLDYHVLCMTIMLDYHVPHFLKKIAHYFR